MHAVRTPLTDLFSYWRDPLGMFLGGMRHRSAAVRYRFGPYTAVQAKRSEHIEHVLIKNQRNYIKGWTYDPLRITLGQGLVTSGGDLWRRQRKLVQPAFHTRSLETFVEKMSRATEDLADELDQLDGQPIDIHEAMVRLTFRIVGLTLFSRELRALVFVTASPEVQSAVRNARQLACGAPGAK